MDVSREILYQDSLKDAMQEVSKIDEKLVNQIEEVMKAKNDLRDFVKEGLPDGANMSQIRIELREVKHVESVVVYEKWITQLAE